LNDENSGLLLDIMEKSQTGQERIGGFLPGSDRLGHRYSFVIYALGIHFISEVAPEPAGRDR
jgi:hypothetical protein